jgi:hypothetical protein
MSEILLYPANKSIIYKEEQFQANILKNFNDFPIKIINELQAPYDIYLGKVFWLSPIGHFTLIIDKSLLTGGERYHKVRDIIKCFDKFITVFLPLFSTLNKYLNKDVINRKPLTDLSFIFDLSETCSLVFIFDNISSSEDYYNRSKKVALFLIEIFETNQNIISKIKNSHKVDKKTTLLLFDNKNDNWEVVDLLFMVGQEKLMWVKKNYKDLRVSKPDMIVDANNLSSELTFKNNWTIISKQNSFIMEKPNDIAIYSSIAEKSKARAQEMWKYLKKCDPIGTLLTEGNTIKFYDYFEEIINALVMSYTAIECMANICIPDEFEYTYTKRKGETITLSKLDIERKLQLKEKLENVIPTALSINSPIGESWWNHFIRLEEIRNEIIHTKENKAEFRYSNYIGSDVFKIISVHHDVVAFYSNALCEVKNRIINDFPINPKNNSIIPSVMQKKSFNNLWTNVFNPSAGNKKK